ncbi:hypothetical protein WK13_30530 [Burkholderia ubonensis]|uniref:MFS transporter n=1 Tax=Burkholderia ubonensis TaxID=101571 RepID=UPI00075AF90C|nr:MFS transporter [Burkholderia ubonensis]KVR26211.1 hypothetical protein WK13_30530 [Burkholderia ubonensis]
MAASSPSTGRHRPPPSARGIAFVVAAIQFTNALEYMAVSPLFRRMAPDFGVPDSYAGYVTGAYTLTAILSGLAAYFRMNRNDPRRTLLVTLATLAATTLAIAETHSFAWLLVLRALAGIAGGITMGCAFGVLLACASAAERPRLLATVVASFSLVSIVGIPMVLQAAERAGWPAAFRLIAACCAGCALVAATRIPAIAPPAVRPRTLDLDAGTVLHAAANAVSQLPSLLIVPVLAPLLALLSADPGSLPRLFFAGGVAGFVASHAAGRLARRLGERRLAWLATAALAIDIVLLMCHAVGAAGFMIAFMASTYVRLVATSSVSVAFPAPEHRAGFSALQTAATHLGTTVAFALSAWLLGGQAVTLAGIAPLLWVSLIGALALPAYLRLLRTARA